MNLPAKQILTLRSLYGDLVRSEHQVSRQAQPLTDIAIFPDFSGVEMKMVAGFQLNPLFKLADKLRTTL